MYALLPDLLLDLEIADINPNNPHCSLFATFTSFIPLNDWKSHLFSSAEILRFSWPKYFNFFLNTAVTKYKIYPSEQLLQSLWVRPELKERLQDINMYKAQSQTVSNSISLEKINLHHYWHFAEDWLYYAKHEKDNPDSCSIASICKKLVADYYMYIDIEAYT